MYSSWLTGDKEVTIDYLKTSYFKRKIIQSYHFQYYKTAINNKPKYISFTTNSLITVWFFILPDNIFFMNQNNDMCQRSVDVMMPSWPRCLLWGIISGQALQLCSTPARVRLNINTYIGKNNSIRLTLKIRHQAF